MLSAALGIVSILLANKGLLPAIILVVIYRFCSWGARYLSGIVGNKQNTPVSENTLEDESDKGRTHEKTATYPRGQTEKP